MEGITEIIDTLQLKKYTKTKLLYAPKSIAKQPCPTNTIHTSSKKSSSMKINFKNVRNDSYIRYSNINIMTKETRKNKENDTSKGHNNFTETDSNEKQIIKSQKKEFKIMILKRIRGI